MIAGITAILVNLVFNYLLIFGNFGFPALGVVGAAIATVISRIIEMLLVIIWTHTNAEKNPFVKGLYKHFSIPMPLTKSIIKKGFPLLLNETLWAGGMAMISQCYSYRGLDVVAAQNIASTISNVFAVVFIAFGNAIGIIIGNILGANEKEKAKETLPKLMAFAIAICTVIGIAMLIIAPLFPNIYETGEKVKDIAKNFICVYAVFMPIFTFTNGSYFTLRAGGKTIITFIFDSVTMWVINIPLVYIWAKYTELNIIGVYIACQSIDIIKAIIGYFLLKKGIWLNNIVEEKADKNEKTCTEIA